MYQVAWHSLPMVDEMNGATLQAARVRQGMSREQLARALGVSLKSVGNWERDRVPRKQVVKVLDVLFADKPLEGFSHWELLSEVGRRVDDLNRQLELHRSKGNEHETDSPTVNRPKKDARTTRGSSPVNKGGRSRGRRSTNEGTQTHGGASAQDQDRNV